MGLIIISVVSLKNGVMKTVEKIIMKGEDIDIIINAFANGADMVTITYGGKELIVNLNNKKEYDLYE